MDVPCYVLAKFAARLQRTVFRGNQEGRCLTRQMYPVWLGCATLLQPISFLGSFPEWQLLLSMHCFIKPYSHICLIY